MGTVTKPTTFVDGTIPTAAQFNGDFDTIYNEFNGSITNANISASAAISTSKVSGTAVNLSDTQTISGVKTFSAATKPSYTTDTDGATVTFNMDTSNIHTVTLGGNRTLAVSNTTTGQAFVIRLLQDGSGSRTVTWFSGISWAGGTAPTLTTTASKADVFGFLTTGSGAYAGFVVGQNI